MVRDAERFPLFDAARGTAMLFVLLSHFANEYFRSPDDEFLKDLLTEIGMVAMPTFVIISGTMQGYLSAVRQGDFARIKAKCVDRGLFYLVVGHLLISVAYWPRLGSLDRSFWAWYITDVLGLCLLYGPTLVQHVGARFRVLGSVLGFFACWAAVYYWGTSTEAGLDFKMLLVGLEPATTTGGLWWYVFPILPWTCVYVGSTAIGERVGGLIARGRSDQVEAFAKTLALSGLAISLSITAVWRAVRMTGLVGPDAARWLPWLSGGQKVPPGPVYLTFFGGVGLVLLYALIRWRSSPRWRPLLSVVGLLGRASFFVFILQYFVYETLLYSLHMRYSWAWPLYFLLSVAVIVGSAYVWDRNSGNRLLSFRVLRMAPRSPAPA
jgi:uncharacterized membrane protein